MCFYHVRGSILRIFFYFFVFPVALRPTCVMSHVGSRNPPPLRSPLRSPLTILPLQMLFQNNQGDSSNEDAAPEAKDAKSPLQCTLTAQILVHGAEHIGALSHIGLKRSVKMLHLQCAQRFPASPAKSADSLFAELFSDAQPDPSLTAVPQKKVKVWSLNYNPLSFLSNCTAHKPPT